MGGSIVGAVDLYFVSCICGRECRQSGCFIYCIMRAQVKCGRECCWIGEIWAGVLLERLIYIYIWAGVLLERLIYILYHVRELFVGGNEVGADIHGREYCWSG